MLSAPAMCANHKKREQVATCGVCSSALCMDCVVHTAVGVKCRKCTGGAAATAPTASARARGVAASGSDKRKKWPVPVTVAGALLILVGGIAFLTRDTGGGSSTGVASGEAEGEETTVGNGQFLDRKADFTGAGGMKLGATLTVPATISGGNASAPGVLIIPGGGAQDRNGGITLEGSIPDPLYADLAESFGRAGIVSLRYDRRGSPAAQMGPGVPVTWDDLIGDAKAGLDFLAQRRETQGKPLTVLGYDQGGFIALRLAGTDPRVKGAVLVSTPGRPLWEVLAFDFQRGIPDPAKGQQVADAMRAAAADLIATGNAPKPDALPAELRTVFSADVPYLRGLFSFDPLAEAAKVKVPTLLVRGGNDGSVLPQDLDAYKGVIPHAETVTSPVGSNTLYLPPGQEGRFHDPSRHGTTRDGDVLEAIDNWVLTAVKP
jgi:pimeloyl-ACP methyl ester carboxylesterase